MLEKQIVIRPFCAEDVNDMRTLCCLTELMQLMDIIPSANPIWHTENLILKWISEKSHSAIVDVDDGRIIGYTEVDSELKNEANDSLRYIFRLHPAYLNKDHSTEETKKVSCPRREQLTSEL